MKLAKILLAVLPTLLLAGSPMPSPQTKPVAAVEGFRAVQLLPEVVEKFFPIASKLSRYPLPLERPIVLVVDSGFFIKHGGCPPDSKTCIVYGMYDIDPKAPDIIYVNILTPPELRAAAIVHEIVHWLQEKNGVIPTTCDQINAVEAEAYVTDFRYLDQDTPYEAHFDPSFSDCSKDPK